MALYTGQEGRIGRTFDANEPARSFNAPLRSFAQTIEWRIDAARRPANVTPKAWDQNISVPSAIDWVATLRGYADRDASTDPFEWFNTLPLTLNLFPLDNTVDRLNGLGYLEELVHDVVVDGVVTWRAVVRMISAQVFV